MQVSVAFKNIEPSDDIKDYLSVKLERFEKIIHHPESVHVVLRLEKLRHIVDVRIVAKRLDVNATEDGSNFNEAIDLVLEKVRKQLIKSKEKTENFR